MAQISSIGPVTAILDSWDQAVGKTIARVDTEIIRYEARLIVRFTDGTALMFYPVGEDGTLPKPSDLTGNIARSEEVFFGLASAEEYDRKIAAERAQAAVEIERQERAQYERLKAKYCGLAGKPE